jgi:hypothetical protein
VVCYICSGFVLTLLTTKFLCYTFDGIILVPCDRHGSFDSDREICVAVARSREGEEDE